MMNITPPPALHGDEQAQLTQIYRYLFRLSESLNATALTVENQAAKASEAVAKAAGVDPAEVSADVGDQYTALVSLVVKTANIVQSQMDKIVTTLNSKYKASGEFGELTEEVRRFIETTAKHTIENYTYNSKVLNIPEMAADFEAYKIEAEGYIKRGIIDYDKDGFPVFGIAIGQELKSREVTIDGVVYTEFDTTKNMATYTAEKLSFWIDGVEVAYLSQSELVVTRIIVSDSIQLGDWDIKVNAQDGLTIQQRIGNEIVTASQINMVADQIDLSGNKSIKLTAEQINAVANEIDLSGNKTIKLTAEQINAVAGQIDLTSNKSITMLAGEVDNLDRLSNIEVIEGTFAQTERREGEGIRIYSEIGPKQDLKWGAPWPGGGGKNLLKNTATTQTVNGVTFTVNADGTVTANGTASDGNAVFRIQCKLSVGETYTLSGCPAGGSQQTYFVQLGYFGNDTGSGVTATATEQTGTSVALLVMKGATVSNLVFKPMLRLASDPDATYAPYANTPPIEGWTGLNAGRSGVQLLDDTELSGIVLNYSHRCDNLFKAVGAYTVSINITGGTEQGITFALRSAAGSIKQYTVQNGKPALIEVTDDILPQIDHCMIYTWSGSVGATLDWIMVNAGSTALPYAPYQGNTYFLDFGGETVYGGKVDWHAGEMTVDRVHIVLTGDENFVNYGSGLPMYYTPIKAKNDGVIVSSHLIQAKNYTEIFNVQNSARAVQNGIAIHWKNIVNTTDFTTFKAEIKAQYNAGTPVEICYEPLEPISIQLTHVQIETLQGINTVYTDADGGRVEFGHSPIEDIQNAVDALEEAAAESALYLKLDAENKVVRIGQTEVTSEFDIDAYGAGVAVGGKSFSRLEGERVLIGGMEMRKPANIGGLAFDSIMT